MDQTNETFQFVLGYIPFGTKDLALQVGRKLVEEKLIACANVQSPEHGMTSIYSWQSKIETSQEWLLHVKTHRSLIAKVEQMVQDLHDYEVPCIVFLPLISINDRYADWLRAQLIKVASPQVQTKERKRGNIFT